MVKLIIVIGLPGSGKTHYLEELKAQKKIMSYYDDYQKKSYGNDNDPILSRHYGPLLSKLKRGQTVAIADINYTRKDELDAVVASVLRVLPEIKVELHYFENNPQKAIINIKTRAREDGMVKELTFVRENTLNYIVPTIKKIEIYSKKESSN
jgi:hypothetical protein